MLPAWIENCGKESIASAATVSKIMVHFMVLPWIRIRVIVLKYEINRAYARGTSKKTPMRHVRIGVPEVGGATRYPVHHLTAGDLPSAFEVVNR
jgi:hypothetical protein